VTYVVTDACIDVKDQKCVQQCPVDCIYLAERSAYIQPDECIDCGACVPVCPVNAILYQEDLSAADQHFLSRQAEVFRGIGAPGGARNFGKLAADHPEVAAAPRKPTGG
jgi:NAD-dependent dihydropyrimidine dehydrogenase PreA subunit